MTNTLSVADLAALQGSGKNVSLTFDLKHLAVKTGKLSIDSLTNRARSLAEYADTVYFRSANGEKVLLKSPSNP